ncbi:MAG TPA: MFS transporter [Casimicrobiaceae bacterium]|nr:MFS transporter [Casimicrobiaceae bacterium]
MISARTARIALVATLAIQIYTSFAATATAVLAPEMAQAFGIDARWIGLFVGIVYAGAMLAGLASGGFIERFGSIRVSQGAVALCAVATLVIAVAPQHLPVALAVAALVIGLGYGPITPASSQLLQRTAAPSRMALTFSIKQTGVPAGVALSGAILPGLALAFGWRTTFVIVALLGAVVVAFAQPIRAGLDVERRPNRSLSLAAIVGPLAILRESPALLALALVSFAYSATQVCLTSFLVVHLTGALGYSLVSAGLILTATTIAGAFGRIGWGVVADRLLAPRRTLALIGVIAAACAIAMALSTPGWPATAIVALAACFGATAIGWNGVQLAEVARLAPPGAAGKVTGATSVVTFAGVVVGPPLFAFLADLTGSDRAGFAMLAAASGAAGAALFVRRAHTIAP